MKNLLKMKQYIPKKRTVNNFSEKYIRGNLPWKSILKLTTKELDSVI